MSNAIIPIIPLDDAPLSSHVLSYLRGIQNTSGRYIFFCDVRDIQAGGGQLGYVIEKAQAYAEPDKPFLRIAIDMREISKAAYNPGKHDPLIAHEATHLSLWTEGYRALGIVNQLPASQWAVQAIATWLADPIINLRIKGL